MLIYLRNRRSFGGERVLSSEREEREAVFGDSRVGVDIYVFS